MTFGRNSADGWQRDVPGSRWFKADLHLHTIDDHLGGRAKLPDGIEGAPADAACQERYARLFLQRLVERDIQVVGLTPHSPRAGSGPASSATWRIVDEWNSGVDDDGVPFREKIYAVFPGFEINVKDGAKGIHLLFLFDPEIGCDRYLSVFDAAMDGVAPWDGSRLRITRKDAEEVFQTLDGNNLGCTGNSVAEFLALGAHFLGSHGPHREMSPQVLETFPVERLAGLGLPQGKLPEDINEKKVPGRYWLPLMRRHRQAFFHASDAYTLDEVGRRHTWIKLASPRIEALRQAFVASDSRMRIGYRRAPDDSLVPDDSLAAEAAGRAWLRRATVEGPASFFGAGGDEDDGQGVASFGFSPDLTCVIGGSMTGKSTLLDGLRTHTEADPPKLEAIREQVEARGKKFRAGSAEVRLDCPGSDPTALPCEQWPAQFFAQNELQQLSQSSTAVESILAKLDSGEAPGIEMTRERLREHDKELGNLAEALNGLDDRLTEAEQAEERACRAQKALKAFEEAGAEDFHRISRARQDWRSALEEVAELTKRSHAAVGAVRSFVLPELDESVEVSLVLPDGTAVGAAELESRWRQAAYRAWAANEALGQWCAELRGFVDLIGEREDSARVEVEQFLAARGHDSAELREFQELSRQAALFPSYARHAKELRTERDDKEKRFLELQTAREALLKEQRAALDRVISGIVSKPDSRIRARRVDNGDLSPLDGFLRSFKQRGITRWWADLSGPSPTTAGLLKALKAGVAPLGMSSAVHKTFQETMTEAQRRRLAALRCPDRYVIELQVDDQTYKPLAKLSGGQRVSVLLTLLLQTEDHRPLVIDQPEDELDNRVLFRTVLPALKRLKGRRQVIVATHNANIVVNGDADLVIQLEATAEKGRVACVGAIDDPAVRDAIVQTVDGGRDAFRLRRRKYGF